MKGCLPFCHSERSGKSTLQSRFFRGFFAALRMTVLGMLGVAAVSAGAAEFIPHMLLLDAAVVGPAIVAVGERGAIVRSEDSGKTWQACASDATATLTAVSFALDAERGWAVGHDALILTTSDRGRTWQKQWQGEN